MKSMIGLALASGLALFVAGCSSGASTTGGGGTQATGAEAQALSAATPEASASVYRTFNVAVKCPGVHYLKKKGWTDQEIMQQMQLTQNDIPACEAWTAQQPKGIVPQAPGGTPAASAQGSAAPGAPAGNAPVKAQ